MFVLLYDKYGSLNGAKVYGKYETWQPAFEAMRSLVRLDCLECDEPFDNYKPYKDKDHAFTPKGDDGAAYKIIEV